MNSKQGIYFRKFALLNYWSIFAIYTLYAAQSPGLTDLQNWHYPWIGVLVMWLLLAGLVGGLHAILRPLSYHNSWGRLLGALAYSAVLCILGFLSSQFTDMPGYFYVPAVFSGATLALVIILVLIQGVVSVIKRYRSTTE